MRRTPSGAHAPVPGASTATVPKPAGRFSRAGSSFIHLAVGGALGQRRGQSLPGRRVNLSSSFSISAHLRGRWTGRAPVHGPRSNPESWNRFGVGTAESRLKRELSCSQARATHLTVLG